MSAASTLSRREAELLALFLARPERILAKSWLASMLAVIDADLKPRSVEVYVHRLRKKLAARGVAIDTVRGQGYRVRIPSTIPAP